MAGQRFCICSFRERIFSKEIAHECLDNGNNDYIACHKFWKTGQILATGGTKMFNSHFVRGTVVFFFCSRLNTINV